MKQFFGLHINREKTVGIVAALTLHSGAFYGVWSYHIIPPPSEALTVFVSYINPASPAKIAEPVVPKAVPPAPVRQEAPRAVIPAVAQLLVSSAPVTSPSEPVAPPPPVARTITVPESAPVVSGLVNVSAGSETVLLNSELSVSCTDRTPPTYPRLSLRLGEQGKTVLLVELDELGRVFNVTVKTKSGFPRLDEAAINAVKTWRCTAAKQNGISVRSVALQPFNFSLKGR